MSWARRWLGPLLRVPTPAIFIVAAALATALLWRQGRLADVGASVRDVSPWKVLAILLVYAVSVLVLGLRWHALTRLAGGTPSWTSSAEVFLTSVIVNYAAPIGLAVPTRVALTVRDLGLTPRQSGVVVAWEAGLDIAALGIISGLWLALGGTALLRSAPLDPRLLIVAAIGVVVTVGALVLASRAGARGSGRAGSVIGILALPLRHPALGLLIVALTVGYWGIQIGVMGALLAVFGVTAGVKLLLGVMGLPILIGMLSPVPGGAGIREALMTGAAGLEGVATGPVLLAAIAYRLAVFAVTPVVWGAVRVARARQLRR
jgi:uncharacterized membrane protein YbhN (UPF0104 family)